MADPVNVERKMRVEGHPFSRFLQDEMNARYWTARDVALRMGGANVTEIAKDELLVNLLLYVDDPKLRLDDQSARKLGRAFDVSPQFFINLNQQWRDWCAARDAAASPSLPETPDAT